MTTIIFYWWLLTGTLVPAESHEGKQMYNIIEENGVIENAYEGEVMEYIKTGTFTYNDFL